MQKGGRNKTPPRGKTPPKNKNRSKTPPKSAKPIELIWKHDDKLHLMLKSNTAQQFRDLLTKLSVDTELAASTEVLTPVGSPC